MTDLIAELQELRGCLSVGVMISSRLSPRIDDGSDWHHRCSSLGMAFLLPRHKMNCLMTSPQFLDLPTPRHSDTSTMSPRANVGFNELRGLLDDTDRHMIYNNTTKDDKAQLRDLARRLRFETKHAQRVSKKAEQARAKSKRVETKDVENPTFSVAGGVLGEPKVRKKPRKKAVGINSKYAKKKAREQKRKRMLKNQEVDKLAKQAEDGHELAKSGTPMKSSRCVESGQNGSEILGAGDGESQITVQLAQADTDQLQAEDLENDAEEESKDGDEEDAATEDVTRDAGPPEPEVQLPAPPNRPTPPPAGPISAEVALKTSLITTVDVTKHVLAPSILVLKKELPILDYRAYMEAWNAVRSKGISKGRFDFEVNKLLPTEDAKEAHANLLEGAEMMDRLRLVYENTKQGDLKEDKNVGGIVVTENT